MDCIGCGSAAVSERSECTVQGYRRFRCRACGKQFNERSAGSLNRTQYPSDVIALVVLWRLGTCQRFRCGQRVVTVLAMFTVLHTRQGTSTALILLHSAINVIHLIQ
jgi:hypothetical protein